MMLSVFETLEGQGPNIATLHGPTNEELDDFTVKRIYELSAKVGQAGDV